MPGHQRDVKARLKVDLTPMWALCTFQLGSVDDAFIEGYWSLLLQNGRTSIGRHLLLIDQFSEMWWITDCRKFSFAVSSEFEVAFHTLTLNNQANGFHFPSLWLRVWLVVWDLLRASAISRSFPLMYLKSRSYPIIWHSILRSRMGFSPTRRLSTAVSGLWSLYTSCYFPSIGIGMESCETKDHTEHLFSRSGCSVFLFK